MKCKNCHEKMDCYDYIHTDSENKDFVYCRNCGMEATITYENNGESIEWREQERAGDEHD